MYIFERVITNYSLEVFVVILNILIYLVQSIRFRSAKNQGGFTADVLYRMGGFFYRSPSFIRLFTSQFVHSNIRHLYNNMFTFVIYSYILSNISQLTSPLRFAIFILSGALATLVSSIRINRGSVAVGASGGVMGLNGAIIYTLLHLSGTSQVGHTLFVVIVFLTIHDFLTQIVGNIRKSNKTNVYVHIIGAIIGFAMAYLFNQWFFVSYSSLK